MRLSYLSKSVRTGTILFLFISLSSIQICFGQELKSEKSIKIKLPQYYDVDGYIFPSSIELPVDKESAKRQFQPTLEEITEAERIFQKIAYMILGQNKNSIARYTNYTRQYTRQYCGFMNEKGEKIVFLEMVDASFPKQLDTNRLALAPLIHTGLVTEYRHYFVNLRTQELEAGSGDLMDEDWFLFRRESYRRIEEELKKIGY